MPEEVKGSTLCFRALIPQLLEDSNWLELNLDSYELLTTAYCLLIPTPHLLQ